MTLSLLTILREAHSGTLAVSLVPCGQSTAVLAKADTEEHPRRQSQVNCPSLGGSPSLAGEKKKPIPATGEFGKSTGEARGQGFPSRFPPAALLYHFLCRCPMGGTSLAKGCVGACLNTVLKPFPGTL